NFPDTPVLNQLHPLPLTPGLPQYRWDGEKWVTATSIDMPGTVRYDTAQTLPAAQQAQARSNIYAAPLDALAFLGLQVNGSCEISQERGNTSFNPGISYSHVQDGWKVYGVGPAGLAYPQYTATAPPPGFSSSIAFNVATPKASLASLDQMVFDHPIEG